MQKRFARRITKPYAKQQKLGNLVNRNILSEFTTYGAIPIFTNLAKFVHRVKIF